MDDNVRTHIDLHADLLEIARLASEAVMKNQVPNDHVLPEGPTHAPAQTATPTRRY
jgi:hypothetical protein